MESFGITNDVANWAIDKLEHAPMSLLEADYIFNLDQKLSAFNSYKITQKGENYVEDILNREEYYSVTRNNGSLVFSKSNRSLIQRI